MIKAFLIDIANKSAKEIDFEPSLKKYYELLKCDTIDIVERSVGGKNFDIICDDEGLMLDKPVISAVNGKCEPMLVGSLLFVHHNGEGETTGLTSDECAHILSHVRHVRTANDPDGHPCVVGLEYC